MVRSYSMDDSQDIPPSRPSRFITPNYGIQQGETSDVIEMSSVIVAVDGDTAVVRVWVNYGAARNKPWRDLCVLGFATDGRCSEFEEWPFAPGQPDGHEP